MGLWQSIIRLLRARLPRPYHRPPSHGIAAALPRRITAVLLQQSLPLFCHHAISAALHLHFEKEAGGRNEEQAQEIQNHCESSFYNSQQIWVLEK